MRIDISIHSDCCWIISILNVNEMVRQKVWNVSFLWSVQNIFIYCARAFMRWMAMARWPNVMHHSCSHWPAEAERRTHRTKFNMLIQSLALIPLSAYPGTHFNAAVAVLSASHSYSFVSRDGAQFIFNIYIVNFRIAKWYSKRCYWRRSSISERSHFVACLFLLLRRFIDR